MTLLRPRWVAGHLLVLVLSVTFIALGFWQVARNDHKQSLVRKAREAYAAPAASIRSAPAAGGRAEASGHYDAGHEVLLRNQVHGGKDGDDVLTPLVQSDGTAVLVDRGWVPAAGSRTRPITSSAASGPVVVRGIVHTSSALRAQDAVTDAGRQLSLPRVDLDRIAKALPYRLLPSWIEMQAQSPEPASGAPALPQPPAPDQVNHTQYAIEWFSFAAIGIIGWPIALIAFSRRRGGFSTPDRRDDRDDRKDHAHDAGDPAEQRAR
ncbi:MAG: surfeit locus 1 family protein [Actinomycetota bacterium]|nr:surfeit locus 1 family protein [Actinomycetota bacterium]